MDEERDWLATYFSAGDDTAAVDETAIEAAAPGEETPPVANDVDETPVSEAIAEADPVAATAAEPELEAPPELPQIDWNHPELAALRAQAEADRVEAEQNRAIKAQLAQVQRQKAATDFQARLAEMADGDPERLQQLNGMIAQVATPAVQQMQAAQSRAGVMEKALAAYFVAAKAHLPEETLRQIQDEFDVLMTVDGPDVMERTAFGKRDLVRQYTETVAEKDRRIAELELAVASQGQLAAREAAGADLVGGAGGTTGELTREERMRTASTPDDYFGALFGRSAA